MLKHRFLLFTSNDVVLSHQNYATLKSRVQNCKKYYKLSISFSVTIDKDLRISKYTILFIRRFLSHKYFMQFASLKIYSRCLQHQRKYNGQTRKVPKRPLIRYLQ